MRTPIIVGSTYEPTPSGFVAPIERQMTKVGVLQVNRLVSPVKGQLSWQKVSTFHAKLLANAPSPWPRESPLIKTGKQARPRYLAVTRITRTAVNSKKSVRREKSMEERKTRTSNERKRRHPRDNGLLLSFSFQCDGALTCVFLRGGGRVFSIDPERRFLVYGRRGD